MNELGFVYTLRLWSPVTYLILRDLQNSLCLLNLTIAGALDMAVPVSVVDRPVSLM